MSLEVTAMVLMAAVMHASWNALIKIQGDRLAVMAVVTAAGSLISLAALPFVESPAPASWPVPGLTILLHTGYHVFLPVAYDHGGRRIRRSGSTSGIRAAAGGRRRRACRSRRSGPSRSGSGRRWRAS